VSKNQEYSQNNYYLWDGKLGYLHGPEYNLIVWMGFIMWSAKSLPTEATGLGGKKLFACGNQNGKKHCSLHACDDL
jgi:hypothetical protein